ncbi:class I SAM-dependent methyltransferase [Streptococcus pluranimalium]|uniref:class I SAM-dependent methyltransferase n=1 Tax=Streptococcus pluranimalium TaxID=82348 RepID=UPI001C4D3AEB|nr:class I SAM-dependent methyltransferase [Streptococcus pluranimalium]MDY3041598.1 class I SAM-dependent methyltransferase [Streptococcus pluranimalium]HEM6116454.1 class I SAM-dependent methyltransferase [Streptococcus suis]
MNFEKIESAYQLILENTQLIENDIKTNIYDALIEQNAFYLGAENAPTKVAENNQALKDLQLSKEEWRRAYQFVFIKASQTEKLQANHQFTPDAIGFLILYLLENLTSQEHLDVIEIGSGTGNLAQTLLNNSNRDLDYLGLELDDLLIDLSASIAEVMGANVSFVQEDAVRPQILKESDVIISDLPVGYYPNDAIAKRYQVAATDEHTYAHHLLMEQSLKYLKKDGLAILLAPTNLLTSGQSDLLKKWLAGYADILAVITLPETLFGNPANAKSLFVLQKQAKTKPETFVYHLSDIQNPEILQDFMENLKIWKDDNAI